jgi:hypothetical protein
MPTATLTCAGLARRIIRMIHKLAIYVKVGIWEDDGEQTYSTAALAIRLDERYLRTSNMRHNKYMTVGQKESQIRGKFIIAMSETHRELVTFYSATP